MPRSLFSQWFETISSGQAWPPQLLLVGSGILERRKGRCVQIWVTHWRIPTIKGSVRKTRDWGENHENQYKLIRVLKKRKLRCSERHIQEEHEGASRVFSQKLISHCAPSSRLCKSETREILMKLRTIWSRGSPKDTLDSLTMRC